MADTETDFQLLNDMAQYDANAKALLAQKPFLANILVRTVKEFMGMKASEVEKFIEGEPIIGETAVDPGFTNLSKIDGKQNESNVPGEGVRYYDIIFDVTAPSGLTKIIINLEAQKRDPQKYDIEMRGLYYAARAVSSQLEREFAGTDYNKIKKVYSIWLIMDCNDNTLNRIHLINEDMLGKSRWNDMYDIINVVIARINTNAMSDREFSLHRLLNAIFNMDVAVTVKQSILEDEFGINMKSDRKELMESMCNLGEGISEKMMLKGMAKGMAKGRAEGMAKGRMTGRAEGLITTCLDFGCSVDEIVKRLMSKMSYSEAEAKKLVAEYV